MKFYFYPTGEEKFKADALNNFVRTIVFNELSGEVEVNFIRQVKTLWQQSVRTILRQITALKNSMVSIFKCIAG